MTPLTTSLFKKSYRHLILLSFLLAATPLLAHKLHPEKYGVQMNFLNASSLVNALTVTKILPPPPPEGSQKLLTDEETRTEVSSTATKNERQDAKNTPDSIFSFSTIIGSHFNSQELPEADAFFKKVDDDTHTAIHIAKKTFERPRPLKPTGYDYPSGHSTRAFVWESLLTEIFPKHQKEFEAKAKSMAWNRVILGHHYPSDISAGETYGRYLAQEFFKNPKFNQELATIKKELKEHLEL